MVSNLLVLQSAGCVVLLVTLSLANYFMEGLLILTHIISTVVNN